MKHSKACSVLELSNLVHDDDTIIVMYKIRFELNATIVPTNQQPFTPRPFPNPMQMQQPLDLSRSNTTNTVWSEGYYGGFPFHTGLVYQGMAPNR